MKILCPQCRIRHSRIEFYHRDCGRFRSWCRNCTGPDPDPDPVPDPVPVPRDWIKDAKQAAAEAKRTHQQVKCQRCGETRDANAFPDLPLKLCIRCMPVHVSHAKHVRAPNRTRFSEKDDPENGLRWCSKCETLQDQEHFYKCNGRLLRWCRTCMAEKNYQNARARLDDGLVDLDERRRKAREAYARRRDRIKSPIRYGKGEEAACEAAVDAILNPQPPKKRGRPRKEQSPR